ncbi:MAG: hypothetical protein ACFE9N_00475 [Promethearchaeota archaeon]
MEFVNFKAVSKLISQLSSTAPVSSKSVLSPAQKANIKKIIWELTGGRSWWTGKPVPYDDAIPHHILHDPMPPHKTLYGAQWENKFEYFAMLSKGENMKVETLHDWRKIQALFTSMWQKFKEGDIEGAVAHWSNQKDIDDFLYERKSKRYLDYWLNIIKYGI